MTSAAAPVEESAIVPRTVTGLWLRHLVSLFFPAVSLTFLWTGPHRWYVAALFLLPLMEQCPAAHDRPICQVERIPLLSREGDGGFCQLVGLGGISTELTESGRTM